MTGGEAPEEGRTWRGQSAEERRTARRAQLIEAGIELFGTAGYAATSVKAVCEEAGLTERYFYEAFSDREGLLISIYEILIEDVATDVLNQMIAVDGDMFKMMRAGLGTFARHVTADPRRAKIQQLEVVGVSEALEERRRGAIHAFADLIANTTRRFGGEDRDDLNLDIVSIGLVGMVNETLVDFVLGKIETDIETLINNQVGIFEALAAVMVPDLKTN